VEAQYLELARRIGLEQSPRIPRLFAIIADPDEAGLMLSMPADVPALAEKFGRSGEETQRMIDLLFFKGLIFPSRKTDPPTWRMCAHLIQFHDASILWPDAPREFLDLWQEFSDTEMLALTRQAAEARSHPVMRVIPVGVSVEVGSQILAFDDVRMAIENADVIAVTKCTCKVAAQKCDTTLECCVQLNNAARYAITRGTGKELTKPEAMALMKQLEEEGLIHTVNNLKSMHQVICNCCRCCCQNFPGMIRYGINSVAPSRFLARIDPDLCTGCESCIERCFFEAIAMKDDTAEVVKPDKCVGCGLCQVVCPAEAICLDEVRSPDYIPDQWSH